MQATMSATGKATSSQSTFSRVCSVSTNIRAKPEVIWGLLTNAANMPKWNSTITTRCPHLSHKRSCRRPWKRAASEAAKRSSLTVMQFDYDGGSGFGPPSLLVSELDVGARDCDVAFTVEFSFLSQIP